MAEWSDQTKLDRLWKKGFNRARGDNSAQFYEENIPSSLEVSASEVYAESIPSVPPSSSTSVIKRWYADADGRILMTLDRKYNDNKVWVAKASFENNFSSGSGDLSNILKNFVDPKYGPSYVVKVYDSNNAAISELDNASWLFDYRSGVLTFEQPRSETGNDSNSCIRIEAFQYVGRMVSDSLTDNYHHVQGIAASTWNINHGLGRKPSVTIFDDLGEEIYGTIIHTGLNNLSINFSQSLIGEAYLI